ncbi:hypothetical protein [Rathayibacter sp. VKM Ac-2927]|uniref:hypothetical protein n=1 Tax=Rathayibacter sp. VKM Ac-2927 TaxID=2929478 RepID=UPI001FB45A5F|nr:hypothetical protein [Rathayibacter sp. VKM Ac-2927]MCJ1688910.1 hypothetical protein [Rathayibacter sp. VKM Ac-2927]
MSLAILEVPFRVEFGPGLSDEDVARIRSSWRSCAAADSADARVVSAEVPLPGSVPPGGVRVVSHSVAQLEESLTSTLTLEAIGERRGDLLMLHACGVAADDGRVLAFVAASGTGKTTASRVLGARFGYVTDETVAVTPDGTVLPYPKPLSVKPATGSAPKAQLSPVDLGLRPVPQAPLVLAGIVLLERRDGVDVPRLEQVEPTVAIDALVPQTSYLAARPRALSALVRTIASVGGANRLVYSEAADVLDLVDGLLAAPAEPAPAVWHDVVALPLEAEDAAAGGSLRRAEVDDALALPSGELLVFRQNTVIRLAGIGPVLWRSAAGGADLPDLVAAVLAELGGPPEGIDASTAVSAAVDELLGLGVIARATPLQPTPEGVHV